MGNGESTYDDSHDNLSMYDDSRDSFPPEPPSYAGTSMDSSSKQKLPSTRIGDNFNSLDQVIASLREAGLESSNLLLGIDFTKSNEWTGKYSFSRKSLHAISSTPNPYEQAISIIGRTLSPFDEDNIIPCFGFGDASTHDQGVFRFYPDDRCCVGFEEALARYREIVPYLRLSGPTSFSPIIDAAIDIVEKNNGQYHVLVIIADGQVTRSPDTPPGRFSAQEQAIVNSIVAASKYPLSIILVGVGDGPWDAMQQFGDNIPQRAFDNFQVTLVELARPSPSLPELLSGVRSTLVGVAFQVWPRNSMGSRLRNSGMAMQYIGLQLGAGALKDIVGILTSEKY